MASTARETANRRSVVALGLAAASMAGGKSVTAQTSEPLAGKDASPFPGIVVRTFGEERSLIPGFTTVSMRDIIVQPGAKLPEDAEMMNAMLCHITEGELRVVQDGKAFTAKKNYAWTCNKGTKEHVVNDGKAVAVMRILDLMA
jgi:hypothetical protein